jgi:hypothetical protein
MEGSMKILLVDDMRNFEIHPDILILKYGNGKEYQANPTDTIWTVRNLHDAHMAINTNGPFDVLLLDNDLGIVDGEKQEGYYLLNWLEESTFNGDTSKLPGSIIPVTSNPAALQRMNAAIEQLHRWSIGR